MTKLNQLSENLRKAIVAFPDRAEMNDQNKKIFFEIVGFAFKEGTLVGKEQYLEDSKKENVKYEQKDQKGTTSSDDAWDDEAPF